VRVLLVSTYELGHQPLHVASPAGALLRAGHEVRCTDMAIDPLDADDVDWAEVVACSVPMHTAMRMAHSVCAGIRVRRPDVALCVYGLYAFLEGARGVGGAADVAIAGEYEPELLRWIAAGAPRSLCGPAGASDPEPSDPQPIEYRPVSVGLGRSSFALPARRLLPPLDRYARLVIAGEERLVGYVEASHGCAHRCRHCPVPVVYDGRTRVVREDALVADVAQLVDAGAQHVSFGDPDFLNGPHHARRAIAAVRGDFPHLTFDVTVKVEHVLAHRHLWPSLARAGVLFVVSAFESASDDILVRLDKGHTVADELEAVSILRHAGIEPRPSLLPFTPWSSTDDVLDLIDLIARGDLTGNVDAVQYSIRLLVPPGSLLLSSGDLDGCLADYDAEHLGWSWRARDARLDILHGRLSDLASTAGAERWSAEATYAAVRDSALAVLDPDGLRPRRAPDPLPALRSHLDPDDRPRLTESWFCCAEPTRQQLAASLVTVPTRNTECRTS